MKTLFREKDERSGDGSGVLLSLTRARGLVPQSEASNRIASAEDLSKYKVCRPGDLVMNRMQAWSGMFALASRAGVVSPDYSVFSAIETSEVKYFEHLFQTPILVDQFAQRSKGIGSGFNRLYTPDFGAVPVVVPPLPEQSFIVRFLGHANRRIERYIRAKKKLIALLNEQKQAIIHQAVTRGLAPNVRLKPSGIPWLADIPEHWEVLRARFLFRAVTRRDVRGDEPKLSVTQRHGLIPTDEMMENSTQAASFERFQVCHPQDLVLNKYKAHLGVFWCAEKRGLITPNYTVFRPARELCTKYFERLFHTVVYRDVFSVVVYGVTEGMSPLYTQDFYSIPVLFPPPAEQQAIIKEVAILTKREDSAITRTEREILLMREYQNRLVADVVTGQLDVRAEAAKLPDEPEEIEPIEDSTEDESEPSEFEEIADSGTIGQE